VLDHPNPTSVVQDIELYKSLAQILQRLGKREVHDMLDYKNVAIIYPTN
jgi:hypothetical protein